MADLSGVWRYDTSEVIAAPAPGYLRSNPAPVSRLAMSTQTWGGANMAADMLRLGQGSELFFQQVNDATLATKVALTAAPIDHSTWVEYPVVAVATSAVGPPNKNSDLLVNGWILAAQPGYVSLAELQRVLEKPSPTAAETDAMSRMIAAAAEEIDWELGYTSAAPAPSPTPPLVVEVNLERAVEHWKQSKHAFAIIPVGGGGEAIPIVTSRDTWYRHARKLAALKPGTEHGFA